MATAAVHDEVEIPEGRDRAAVTALLLPPGRLPEQHPEASERCRGVVDVFDAALAWDRDAGRAVAVVRHQADRRGRVTHRRGRSRAG